MIEACKLQFVPLTQHLVQACNKFNERLRQAGFVGEFSCSPNRDRSGKPPDPMEVETFVGVDAEGEVRGGYLLRWQFLWLRGERLCGANYGYPISEGIIDRRYGMVGVSILRDVVKRCEYLYLLGGGRRNGNVFFRVAQHVGWEIQDVPFLFRVIRGRHFFRKLPQMQRGPKRRLFATLGSATGLPQVATAFLHAGSAIGHGGSSSLHQSSNVTVEEMSTLSTIADEVWSRVNSQYAFCVVRDSAHVAPSFPPDRTDIHRLVVRRQGSIIGWSVVMTKGLSRLRAYLGDVVPGLIVDAFGDTRYATDIVRAATAYLAAQGVDIVITNTSHSRWLAAFKGLGFLTWRSQFPLIVSQPLARRIGNFPGIMRRTHISRGDGDGVHYLH